MVVAGGVLPLSVLSRRLTGVKRSFVQVRAIVGHRPEGRNYDFSIGSMAEFVRLPLPAEARDSLRPIMSEPYIMVWHPTDGGYATLAVHAFDLLAGALEGINSAGLVVSILADHTAINELGPKLEPHPGPAGIVSTIKAPAVLKSASILARPLSPTAPAVSAAVST